MNAENAAKLTKFMLGKRKTELNQWSKLQTLKKINSNLIAFRFMEFLGEIALVNR